MRGIRLLLCLAVAAFTAATAPAQTRATGDQHRQYLFAPTGQQMPYRVYVPKSWDGKASLPIVLFLHGAGANESTYLDIADGMLRNLAEKHGYIVVSPLGFTPLGAYGNPLRLPAVFGQSAIAEAQVAAVTPQRRRELNLSELEVITALDVVTEEYGADRARTYLAGHSMGSGGVWHLAARYPDRWRAIAPMSGPFVDEKTYPFERIRPLPIFMTEGTGAKPSLEGSRAMAKFLAGKNFDFKYMEVDGDHGGMVPMVWPAVFDFFDAHAQTATPATAPESSAAMAERIRRWRAELPQGTGPHRVMRVIEPDLTEHTVYRPADLRRAGRLPIVAFANGACRNTSTEYAGFLSEIASHGYLVIAVGRDDQPFELGPDSPRTAPDGRPMQVLDEKVLVAAVDWAIARNADRRSVYHHRLDTNRIAYMGHSCGGMQALTAGADPRATTTVVLNSGYYRTLPAKPPGPLPAYRRWSELHAPTLILTGGPKDVAYRIARDSFEDGAAANLPIFLASLPTVAHGGAYVAPDREWSRVVLAWLDWQLKGDRRARTQFIGQPCGLCANAAWQDVQGHGLR